MKIYNVVQYGGEFDDYYEYIKGVFTIREEAERLCDFLSEVEADKVAKTKMCQECIFGCGDEDPCGDLKLDKNKEDCENCNTWAEEDFYRIDEEVVYNDFEEWMVKNNWKRRF